MSMKAKHEKASAPVYRRRTYWRTRHVRWPRGSCADRTHAADDSSERALDEIIVTATRRQSTMRGDSL